MVIWAGKHRLKDQMPSNRQKNFQDVSRTEQTRFSVERLHRGRKDKGKGN